MSHIIDAKPSGDIGLTPMPLSMSGSAMIMADIVIEAINDPRNEFTSIASLLPSLMAPKASLDI
jgi:hypothetical protein